MLWKILITALVIVGAFAYLRRRSRLQQADRQRHRVSAFLGEASRSTTGISTMAGKVRLALWVALTVILLIGTVYSFFQWRDAASNPDEPAQTVGL